MSTPRFFHSLCCLVFMAMRLRAKAGVARSGRTAPEFALSHLFEPPVAGVSAVAVFCGSREGSGPGARAAAVALGAGLAARGIRLVYGGGRVGLMGAVADAVLADGGLVTGVIPEFLTRLEVAHIGLTALHVTGSMHDRKAMMFDLADAFVTLPGGFGTLDETIEIATWRQLGLHDKPILLCNAGGWADPLLAALRATVAQGFAGEDSLRLIETLADVPATLARLEQVRPQARRDSMGEAGRL